MGFRYYKRVNLGGGFKLNFSKTGVGISGGVPGARYSVHSSGRTVKTVGLHGTGLYYRKDTYAKGSRSRPTSSRALPPPPTVQMYPKAGLLAPKEEKEFVKGVTAFMQGRHRLHAGAPRRRAPASSGMSVRDNIALDADKDGTACEVQR